MATAQEATQPHTDVEKVVSTTDNESVAQGMVKKLDDKILKHSHDADAAMKAFEGMDGQVIELTPEKNKALLRKIDWHLMPVSDLTVLSDQSSSWRQSDGNR
jgi:ACS family allantoate permease-like MFS transporter